MASTTQGVVGLNGKVPWYYKDEILYFKKITYGSIVVTGSTTYNLLPKSLFINRHFIVFSRQSILYSNIFEHDIVLGNIYQNIFTNIKKKNELRVIYTTQLCNSIFGLQKLVDNIINSNLQAKNGNIAKIKCSSFGMVYPHIFMIGGAEIAYYFLKYNLLSCFLLTVVKNIYPGDTYLNIAIFNNKRSTTLYDCQNYKIIYYFLNT